MNWPLTIGFGFICLITSAGGWLGWQLLRQNGRILLRLDKLEKRLHELEFGLGGELRMRCKIGINNPRSLKPRIRRVAGGEPVRRLWIIALLASTITLWRAVKSSAMD